MLAAVGPRSAEDAERVGLGVRHALRSLVMADEMQEPQPTQLTRPRKNGAKPIEIPVPTRGAFESFVRKVAGRGEGRKRPVETDPPPAQSESR